MGSIVLAGGRSRRMGRDKARLPWAGDTLLGTVIRILASVSHPVIVVAASAVEYDLGGSATVIVDDYPGQGPLGGVITGLHASGPGAHIVVACDMPALQPALLRRMLAIGGDHDAVVPVLVGGPEPLCAVYNAQALPKLAACFAEGNRAMHAALKRLDILPLHEEQLRAYDPHLLSFTNINTPEEAANMQSGPIPNE